MAQKLPKSEAGVSEGMERNRKERVLFAYETFFHFLNHL
jgi:hypothetical protein